MDNLKCIYEMLSRLEESDKDTVMWRLVRHMNDDDSLKLSLNKRSARIAEECVKLFRSLSFWAKQRVKFKSIDGTSNKTLLKFLAEELKRHKLSFKPDCNCVGIGETMRCDFCDGNHEKALVSILVRQDPTYMLSCLYEISVALANIVGWANNELSEENCEEDEYHELV